MLVCVCVGASVVQFEWLETKTYRGMKSWGANQGHINDVMSPLYNHGRAGCFENVLLRHSLQHAYPEKSFVI